MSLQFQPALWPSTTRLADGGLTIGGMTAVQAAAEFGTPAYLLDEADFKARATGFRDAFAPWQVFYASKAFLCRAVARWAADCGLGVDVCSLGELTVALRAGVPPSRIGLHGNNKSDEELRAAVASGVGRIVVDAADEIDRLETICRERPAGASPIPVLVRVTPDVQAHTHAHVQTAVADQKFGFAMADGSALAALLRLDSLPGVGLLGVHCHIGSQIFDYDGYDLAIARLVGLLAQFRDAAGRELPECDMGGGFGIAYTGTDRPLAAAAAASHLHEVTQNLTTAAGLAPLRWSVEPGRAIVGPAMVALYTVGVVKQVNLPDGPRTYVAVDGGMGDNPRPALYQAEYAAWLANRASKAGPVRARVVGKYCETADVLVRHTFLPGDVRPGDLIAVPCGGAYQRAMASNYNGSLRPPVIGLRDGVGTVLVRRETLDDFMALDVWR